MISRVGCRTYHEPVLWDILHHLVTSDHLPVVLALHLDVLKLLL